MVHKHLEDFERHNSLILLQKNLLDHPVIADNFNRRAPMMFVIRLERLSLCMLIRSCICKLGCVELLHLFEQPWLS